MADYSKTLNRLSSLLENNPMTAREISKRLRCCIPAVYSRVAALRVRGVRVTETRTESNKTGPSPVRFSVDR